MRIIIPKAHHMHITFMSIVEKKIKGRLGVSLDFKKKKSKVKVVCGNSGDKARSRSSLMGLQNA